jgi:peptidoglycan/LPS O-acetylase OafA/YrhL
LGQTLSSVTPAAGQPALPYRLLGLPRFVLALLVAGWHGLGIAGWAERAVLATDFAAIAVFVFFLLSGYIITEAVLAFYRGRPVAFFANRLVRIWPAYLVALALMALLLAVLGLDRPGQLTPANLAANTVALFPTVIATDPLLGLAKRDELLPIVWALRVEFVFYALVALALLAGRLGAGRRWLLPALWLALAGNIAFYHLYGGLPRATLYFGMAPYFVLGVALALRRAAVLPARALAPLLAGGVILAILHVLNFSSFDGDAPAWQRPVDLAGAQSLALFLLLAGWSVWRMFRQAAPARATRDRLLGNLTYELYLVHVPVIVLVDWLWPEPHWSNLLLALTLSVAAAAALSALMAALLRPLRRRLRGAGLPGQG